MLTPEYLQRLPDSVVELYAQAEADILADMARRINGFDLFIPSAQYQMERLEEMGALRRDIVSKLSGLTGKSRKELAAIMQEAGVETLSADEKIYQAAGLVCKAELSPAVQEVLSAGLQKTGGLFKNLTKTTANTAARQFENALDRAYLQVTSGAFDPSTAVRSAIKHLAQQGVGAITYPSGHVDTLEVAVRRALVTGVNQTCLQMQEARADELGCDLVETTAHSGARPSHAEWQGQVFSRSGRSKKYPDFVQVTGYGTGEGLGGWNCSHSFYPFFEGLPRAYSDKQLSGYNEKKYEYNGKKMTEYEALQQQRGIERHLRRWKRENLGMKAAGQDTTESAVKIAQWQAVQKDFINQTGLKRQRDREQIAGWSRKTAVQASGSARSAQRKAQNEHSFTAGVGSPKTNLEYINSAAYKKKFSGISENPALNDALYRYSRAAVTHQSEKFTEDLFVLDKRGRLVGHTSSKEEYQTEYTASLKKAVAKAEPYSLVSVHSHGTNVPPSGADLVSAGSKRYAFGIVARHDGKVYYYSAAKARPFLPGVIDDAVDKYLSQSYNLSVEEAFERALNNAAKTYGIEWRELK